MKKHSIAAKAGQVFNLWLGRSLALPVAGLMWLGGSLALPVEAQVIGFGGGSTITGTVTTPAEDTNAPSIGIRHINLNIQMPGATIDTNFTGQVWITYNTNSIATITNGYLAGGFAAAGFNSTNVSINGYYVTPPAYAVFVAFNGTNNPSVVQTYGPNLP